MLEETLTDSEGQPLTHTVEDEDTGEETEVPMTVADKLSEALPDLLGEDVAGRLLGCETGTFLRPGAINGIGPKVGNDPAALKEVLDVLGSCYVRYLKS